MTVHLIWDSQEGKIHPKTLPEISSFNHLRIFPRIFLKRENMFSLLLSIICPRKGSNDPPKCSKPVWCHYWNSISGPEFHWGIRITTCHSVSDLEVCFPAVQLLFGGLSGCVMGLPICVLELLTPAWSSLFKAMLTFRLWPQFWSPGGQEHTQAPAGRLWSESWFLTSLKSMLSAEWGMSTPASNTKRRCKR